jgi:hypothetical protein
VIRNLYSAFTIDSSTPTSTPDLKKHPLFYNTFNFVLKPRQTILKRVKDITIECFCHYYEMYHIISCSTIWPKYVSSNYFATSCNCNIVLCCIIFVITGLTFSAIKNAMIKNALSLATW